MEGHGQQGTTNREVARALVEQAERRGSLPREDAIKIVRERFGEEWLERSEATGEWVLPLGVRRQLRLLGGPALRWKHGLDLWEWSNGTPTAVESESEDVMEVLEELREEGPEKWAKVVAVTEATADARPKWVRIECQDPQGECCDEQREVAVQDLHRVYRCVPCQHRATNRRKWRRRTRRAKAES